MISLRVAIQPLPGRSQQPLRLLPRALSSLVRSEFDEGTGAKTLTMTSPKTANALSLEMLETLTQEVECSIAGVKVPQEGLRSIVVRGEGKIFSAGHNLKEMTVAEGTVYHQKIFDQCNRLMRAIGEASVPVVAAVDGVAAAAGCQLVAMCDIAVATKRSKFSVPGANVGIFCSTPGIPLGRMVPRKVSSYMLYTGLPISAKEAYQAGLISRLVEDTEALDSEVATICQAIGSKPKGVIALGKRFYYKQMEMGISSAFEEGGQVMVDNLKYADAQEGIEAFKKKRKPVWTHSDNKVM